MSPTTIEAAAAEIEASRGRHDMLVSNVGINERADSTPRTASITAVRSIFDTNFFGVLAVTQAVLALLRKSGSGRVVDVFIRLAHAQR